MTYNKLVNGVVIPMTKREVEARKSEEADFLIQRAQRNKIDSLRKSLAQKWPDAFSLIDDILERGLEAVKSDRDALKGKSD